LLNSAQNDFVADESISIGYKIILIFPMNPLSLADFHSLASGQRKSFQFDLQMNPFPSAGNDFDLPDDSTSIG
jgi:hypothetical protein